MPRASHLNTHASSGTDPICSSAVETIPTWCLIGWILSGFCLVTTLAWITVYFVMRIRSKRKCSVKIYTNTILVTIFQVNLGCILSGQAETFHIHQRTKTFSDVCSSNSLIRHTLLDPVNTTFVFDVSKENPNHFNIPVLCTKLTCASSKFSERCVCFLPFFHCKTTNYAVVQPTIICHF